VSDRAERMSELRKNPAAATDPKELDHLIEVVDWGVRTFSSYVGTSSILSFLIDGIAEPSH
jgi:exportin-T